jgi:hypothetical protein
MKDHNNVQGNPVWMVFIHSAQGGWDAVSRHKQYLDLQGAIRAKESLEADMHTGCALKVLGFTSLNGIKIHLSDEEAQRHTINHLLYVAGGLSFKGVRKSSIASDVSSRDQRVWKQIKRLQDSVRFDLADLFTVLGFTSVDKRQKNGCLWVVGDDPRLEFLMSFLNEKAGIRFRFTREGGRASKHQPAWYYKQAVRG